MCVTFVFILGTCPHLFNFYRNRFIEGDKFFTVFRTLNIKGGKVFLLDFLFLFFGLP